MPNDDVETLAAVVKATAEGMLAPFHELLQQLLGPAVTEVGQGLADSARVWRLERQIRLWVKVKNMVETANLPIKPVAPRLLFPILEAASLEDDDNLQSHWAGLLSNAATDPNSVHPSFIEVLRQLTPEDAQLLDRLYDSCESKRTRTVRPWVDPISYAEREERVAAGENPMPSFQNLMRLGLIETEYEIDKRGTAVDLKHVRFGSAKIPPSKLETHYELTEFAVRFVQACRALRKID